MPSRTTSLEEIRREIKTKRDVLDQLNNARMAIRAHLQTPSMVFAAAAAPLGHRSFKLLAQGDSWFDYPPGRDIIDCLHENHGHTIDNLAVAGSTLNDEAYGPVPRELFGLPFGFPQSDDPSRIAELVHRIEQDKPDALLLSAGGNDVAGDEFFSFINNARSGLPAVNQAVLDGVIRDTFEPAYEFLIGKALDTAASAGIAMPVFLHGYDYPFPDGRGVVSFLSFKVGPWFDGTFSHKNYPNANEQDLQVRHDILVTFINSLNDMQKRLVQNHPGKVFHVDVRGTLLRRDEWANELHPGNPGFAKIAQRIDASLQQNISLTAKPAIAAAAVITPRRVAATAVAAVNTRIEDQLTATGTAQVLVVLRSAAAAAAAASGGAASSAKTGHPVASRLRRHFIQPNADPKAPLALSAGVASHAVMHFPNLGVMLGTVNNEGLTGLWADEGVQSVEAAVAPTLVRPVDVRPASLTSQTVWGIDFLHVPALWNQGLSGKNIVVAHLDTGVDGKHPALKSAIASFAAFDFMGRAEPNLTARDARDTGEHGTHTAATIAGRSVKGKAVGVAPGSRLSSAIVIEGGNVVARILAGMDWALGQPGVRVLSMSLGLRGVVNSFLAVTQIIRSRNILPVFAVGNEGPGTSRSPGNYAEALSVGAVDSQRHVPDFSSSQRFLRTVDPLVPDLVAPGVDVISAKPGGGFQSMSGSSMATPHIAGLAALLFEAKRDATVHQVEDAIFRSCTLTGIPPGRGNRGVPDAARAFTLLTGIALNSSKGKSASAGGRRRKPKKVARSKSRR